MGSSKIQKILHNPALLFLTLGQRGFFNWMSDEQYLRIAYRIRMGKKLDLDNPITFNEKLQWLKLHDRKPEYTQMVDKIEAKKLVANAIGEEYIIPTLGVWNHFDEIDFDKLPDQFVLKCSHDSGGVIICRDKSIFDKVSAKKTIEKCLKRNFYWGQREWPYKDVIPRILAEPFIEDSSGELLDYKIFCFNGKAQLFKIDFDRFVSHHANYYSTDCALLPFGEKIYPPVPERKLRIPPNFNQMISIAQILSRDLPFARVDFYNVDSSIFFGEITLYPISGLRQYTSDEWDLKLGDMLKLPVEDNNEGKSSSC